MVYLLLLGNVNQNVDPSPNTESTPICPFICSTMLRQIESPSPVPGINELSFTNLSKILCLFSSSIPIPVSVTENLMYSSSTQE